MRHSIINSRLPSLSFTEIGKNGHPSRCDGGRYVLVCHGGREFPSGTEEERGREPED